MTMCSESLEEINEDWRWSGFRREERHLDGKSKRKKGRHSRAIRSKEGKPKRLYTESMSRLAHIEHAV